jgi:hypothetical protein
MKLKLAVFLLTILFLANAAAGRKPPPPPPTLTYSCNRAPSGNCMTGRVVFEGSGYPRTIVFNEIFDGGSNLDGTTHRTAGGDLTISNFLFVAGTYVISVTDTRGNFLAGVTVIVE